MFDALISKYASLAFMVVGSGLSIFALRAVKRWVFWLLLLIAIPCLLLAGTIYWYVSNYSGGRMDEKFQASLKVGMTESDVMLAVDKYYPKRDAHRPTVLQNGAERLGIFIPGGEDSREKMIHLRFENGRVAEVTGR
ncbi:hypothetical protein DES53_102162 [Roseimicrobium gellanilyticum]|uniref:Uncharacterized protein n=1 Tax=Roseimicrobium gellanilyticum TaxID=748857 RepID=A0A366HQ59_9BACT|nr:hypothetical protein [Roseimicrobium gellanilyticum]RBP45780.1 hypothetical protein DES53_102162 [Roseimicrobium gellanilyticum]